MNIFKNRKPVIAIDGTAGSGKGTLAKNISKILKFDHLDTGLLYRIYAFETLNGNKPNLSPSNLILWLNDEKKLKRLRTEKISKFTSEISQHLDVRKSLVTIQREFADNPPKGFGSVIDGRDIATVIVPNAEVKFFVDADVNIRANRRTLQLKLKPSEYKLTLSNMIKRDKQDSKRKISPLKKAKDSFHIDTSNINEKKALETALNHIKKNTDFI